MAIYYLAIVMTSICAAISIKKNPSIFSLCYLFLWAVWISYLSISGSESLLMIIKATWTLLVVLYIVTDNRIKTSRLEKFSIVLMFFAVLLAFYHTDLFLTKDKAIGYILFSMMLFKHIWSEKHAPTSSFVLFVVAVMATIVGARGVIVAICLGFITSYAKSRLLKVWIYTAVIFIYSYLLVSAFEIFNLEIGKSENDRFALNIYTATRMFDGYFLPDPAIIKTSNILEHEDSEGVFVHNYFLIALAYVGPLVLITPIYFANAVELTTEKTNEVILHSIVFLLLVSPESQIARFLLFGIPFVIRKCRYHPASFIR